MHPEQDPFEPGAVRLLTSAFDIKPADVTADAYRILEWRGSNDDLFVFISNRYRWPATTTARYLRDLRFALRRGLKHSNRQPEE